jgi:aldose 1-epimerase
MATVNKLSATMVQVAKHDDLPVYKITLANGNIAVVITNLGCTIVAVNTPDRQGLVRNVVAGFRDILSYDHNPHYLGCTLGRYAGRISKGKFRLEEREVTLSLNEADNHLHGGFSGFNNKIWAVSAPVIGSDNARVTMNYVSPDGEEGYPGELWNTG